MLFNNHLLVSTNAYIILSLVNLYNEVYNTIINFTFSSIDIILKFIIFFLNQIITYIIDDMINLFINSYFLGVRTIPLVLYPIMIICLHDIIMTFQ